MTSASLLSALLEGPHECLVKVALRMDREDIDDWQKLWSELVKQPMDEAVAKYHPEGPTIYTLKLWVKAVEPSETTVGRLIKALSAIYRNDAAEVLLECAQVSL